MGAVRRFSVSPFYASLVMIVGGWFLISSIGRSLGNEAGCFSQATATMKMSQFYIEKSQMSCRIFEHEADGCIIYNCF